MKIIEGLKRLKLIQKKVEQNCNEISQYSAYDTISGPKMGNEEEQRVYLEGLIQSTKDLELEYLRIKRRIEKTNFSTFVDVDGVNTYTISDLISIRRIAHRFRKDMYNSMNNRGAMQVLQDSINRQGGVNAENPPKVVSLFDEAKRNKSLTEWQDFVDKIDSKLEVVNAETELLDVAA